MQPGKRLPLIGLVFDTDITNFTLYMYLFTLYTSPQSSRMKVAKNVLTKSLGGGYEKSQIMPIKKQKEKANWCLGLVVTLVMIILLF